MIDLEPQPGPAMPGTLAFVRLLAIALLLGACATNSIKPRRQPPAAGVYGVSDDRLTMIGGAPSSGATVSGATVPGATVIDDVGALTYDPRTLTFYAIADASSKPRLTAIDPNTGEAMAIGPIEAPGLDLTIAEGLAFNPGDNTLYAAAGESTFASNVLLTVDPATGKARQVARIRGTIQNEIDAMAFADGVLHAVDGAGNVSALYRIDLITGRASRLGRRFAHAVVDLSFDPGSRRLVGTQGTDGPLLAFSIAGESAGEMAINAGVMSALEIIPSAGNAALFHDGFESGDASAWSKNREQKQ